MDIKAIGSQIRQSTDENHVVSQCHCRCSVLGYYTIKALPWIRGGGSMLRLDHSRPHWQFLYETHKI